MPRIELVYFPGCPGIEPARTALRAAGAHTFVEIDQGSLDPAHPYCRLSSPSILLNGEIVAGSRNPGSACSMIDWAQVSRDLAKNIRL